MSTVTTSRPLGRAELLAWLNTVLGSHEHDELIRVEQCSTGVAFCRLFARAHPSTLPLHKVIDPTANRRDAYKNYVTLQHAMHRAHVERPLAIERLIAGKFQDNWELLQWFYDRYHDTLVKTHQHQNTSTVSQGERRPEMQRQRSYVAVGRTPQSETLQKSPRRSYLGHHETTDEEDFVRDEEREEEEETPVVGVTLMADDGSLDILGREVADAAAERDLYFEKLRSIEMLCEMHGAYDPTAADRILAILAQRAFP
jgi:RP/EB family microtubule-associated protein